MAPVGNWRNGKAVAAEARAWRLSVIAGMGRRSPRRHAHSTCR
ncbi:MAG: hypothetical protein ACR2PY_04995 [Salinispira sp.]